MIIYIHGFNSSGESSRVDILREHFKEVVIYSPTYDCSDFSSIDIMINEIEEKIKNESNVLFIGSSLGGYIAQYLAKQFNAKSMLLNPATNVSKILSQFIGYNENFQTGEVYELTIENINKLSKYYISEKEFDDTNISVFLNKDDEIVPYRETKSFYDKINRPVTIFNNGGHRFENMHDILNHIERIYNMAF